jgi:hypothetical protein
MALNKLEAFILFNLFKLPAIFAVVAVGGLYTAQAIKENANQTSRVARMKEQIKPELLSNYGHLLMAGTTLQSTLGAKNLSVSVLSTNPVQIGTDLNTAQEMEKFGILASEAAFADGKITLGLKTYPPHIK